MSTRERAYELLDELDEEQLEGLIMLLKGMKNENKKENISVDDVQGILSDYANPDLIPLEEGAWERAAVEKYENS